MRCRSCGVALTDYEATIRSVYTREYLDMCKTCLESIKADVVAVGNVGLMSDDGGDDVSEISGLLDDFKDDDYFEDRWNER
jgi:hypothetical protein